MGVLVATQRVCVCVCAGSALRGVSVNKGGRGSAGVKRFGRNVGDLNIARKKVT